MELVVVERASAPSCEFDRVAAAVDAAEAIAWDRIGGPNAADADEIKELEARLAHLRPSTLEGWRWSAQRLARAVDNEWCQESMAPLLRLTA